jgi:hypothetical protein
MYWLVEEWGRRKAYVKPLLRMPRNDVVNVAAAGASSTNNTSHYSSATDDDQIRKKSLSIKWNIPITGYLSAMSAYGRDAASVTRVGKRSFEKGPLRYGAAFVTLAIDLGKNTHTHT